MKLTFIRKIGESNGDNCPALYAVEGGGYVVQGKVLDDETRAQLRSLGVDETAVFIPADVIAGIVAAA